MYRQSINVKLNDTKIMVSLYKHIRYIIYNGYIVDQIDRIYILYKNGKDKDIDKIL